MRLSLLSSFPPACCEPFRNLRRRSDAVPVRALIRDIIAVCRIVSDLSDIFIYLVSSD